MKWNKFYKKYLYFYFSRLKILFLLFPLLFQLPQFIFSITESNISSDYSIPQAISEKSNIIPEGWIPYVPTDTQTEIEIWLSEGTVYAEVTFTFEDSGYQVSDWGTITKSENELSVNTQVLKWTEISLPVVTIKSNTYPLGELAPGIYTFIIKSWDTAVESKQFNTQPVYVPDDFPTIQAAIDGVLEGGEIIVKEGTYVENINFKGKNINLHSTDPTNQNVVENTIIYGDGISYVVRFSGTQNENCILSGFTITNGVTGILGISPYATTENSTSKATIQYNIIKNNTSYGYGAGVCFCDGKIQYNTITENYAPSGGGGLYQCNGTIQYNTITNNYRGGLSSCNGNIQVNIIANNNGYGLGGCDGLIQYNTIVKNSGTGLGSCNGTIQFNNIWYNIVTDGNGGGLSYCNGTIYNNHIWKNSAKQYGGGLYNCDGVIVYNDIWDNSASSGGGLSHCDLYIVNNIIWLNKAKGFAARGGGIYYCTNLIQNNMIFSNSSDQYGGAISDSNLIQNNTIWGNIAKNNGGGLNNCSGTIRNCVIWNNSAPNNPQLNNSSQPTYSCVQNLTGGGVGNISNDPLLYDTEMGDFHLTSDSLCIDAGMLIDYMTNDFEGDTRPFDGSPISRGDDSDYDIGADEYDASPPIVRPDKPTNISPIDGATNVPLPITLTSSPFPSVIPEDFHLATHWQIDTNENFNSTELKDFFETVNRTSITIPKYYFISSSNQFFWRVRYLRGDYIWGKWSEPTSFTTIPVGNIIKVPDDVPTIQDAINAAIDGIEIIVSEATYYENLYINGKNIILRSTDPTNDEVVKNTIINGNLSGSVISFSGTETENCKISGFTITNGGPSNNGGGVNGNSTKATISYNKIVGNEGGGLYDCDGLIEHSIISYNMGLYGNFSCGLYGCDGIIRNNTISENFGLGLDSCQGTIQNNLIMKNNGCGVYNCDGIIDGNEIRDNIDYHYTLSGGGLSGCNGVIQNNTITENVTSQGAGLLSCAGGLIQNNIISDNIAYSNKGGGLLYCNNIKNNIISNNWGSTGGGLSNCQNIENNIITNNWAYGLGGSGGYYGGGGLERCSGIRRNIICGNSASNGGGGLDNCTEIDNNLIYNNQADYGGGILSYMTNFIMRNNTIYNNYAYYNGGGILIKGTYSVEMQNCIFWQNSSPNNAQIALDDSYYPQLLPEYCCIQEWTGAGTGNITDDPQLVDPDGSDNDLTTWEDNNFHLLYKSPCIDAGMFIEDLTQDFEGNPRPYNACPEPRGDGSDFDIGAYEFIGSTTNAENWMLWL